MDIIINILFVLIFDIDFLWGIALDTEKGLTLVSIDLKLT